MALATSGADYDVDLAEVDGQALSHELNHYLWLKGYCVLNGKCDDDVLEDACDELGDLKRGGRFASPPQQTVDGILGPEGTKEIAWLTPADDADYADGGQLKLLAQEVSMVADSTATFRRDAGMDAQPTRLMAVRGGEVSDEIVDMSEKECGDWMNMFSQAKLMVIYFAGPGEGTLELQPLDDESGAVEVQTRKNMVVVLRADTLLHRHVSGSGDHAIVCWMKAPNASGCRGWNKLDRSLGERMPVVKELLAWMDERLAAIMQLEADEKLDDTVPREWVQMAHHAYFRKEKNPVAVRGMAGHLPGQWDPEVFWESLNQGIDYITEVPAMRWSHDDYYDPEPNSWMQSLNYRPPTFIKTNVKHGCYMDGAELFDTRFFGISVMEAKGMDPMQKHILETSYECLHMAGYKKKELMNNYIAVYTGCANPEWNYIDREAGACSGTGSSQAITSNRTSFILGMMGPSSSIDCDMSSASVALMVGSAAVATTNERRRETQGNSTAACVGGVYMNFTPFLWPRFNAWMNPNGRCFTFDQSANGYVRGEMCGSVCLKPYADRIDNDWVINEGPCVGTIKGWRMVSNGRGASLSAPHGPAEQECIFDAVRDACIDPRDVDGVDCHGSGGLLDDSIEVMSLAAVLRGMKGGDQESLIMGAVKSNASAQCEACGMAQLFKVLCNISFANNAPNVHLKTLNPHVEFWNGALQMNAEALAYRNSGVFHGFSSRGLGGTIVHGVVWYTADGGKVRVDKPNMDRMAFNYWPGGGGMLEAGCRPAQGYYIAGSWGQWEQVDEMRKNADGNFSFVVTLGANRFEHFQIWLDGESHRVLHPDVPAAASGSTVHGPSEPSEAEGLRWRIDGRGEPGAQLALAGDAGAPPRTRDQGRPGDKYEVTLMIAGKYRAVSWRKVFTAAPSGGLEPSLVGRYYVAGSWSDWSFQELAESAPGSGLYSANVRVKFGRNHFVIVRNRDWDQVFYPASQSGEALEEGSADGDQVAGPDEAAAGTTWLLSGGEGRDFLVEFQRSFEGGSDLRRVAWRATYGR